MPDKIPAPMLAADLAKIDNDLTQLKLPAMFSPKLDGIRCLVWEGVAYSRNHKPIPNQHVQAWAKNWHNLDGELIVGDPTAPDCYNASQSAIMSVGGSADFQFHLFDSMERHCPEFADNFWWLKEEMQGEEKISIVPHVNVGSLKLLEELEAEWLRLGYEGAMLRALNGPYKQGRSTLKEGWLIKLKRFTDGEARVVAIEAAETNTNEAFKDELGRTKRSSAKAGKVSKPMVGTIVAECPVWGELRLAPGKMKHDQREYYWAHPNEILGREVHYRSFGYGVKDKPRFPRFYGFRDEL